MFFDFYKERDIPKIGQKIIILTNKNIVKILNSFFQLKNTKFLEIGVGHGIFANILTKEIPTIKYFGIDANKDLCQQAKEKGLNVTYAQVPPIPKKFYNKFDFVYMAHLLEHFTDFKEVLNVLCEIKKVLKNKGKLIIFYPDWLDSKEDYFNVDYTHSYILTELRVKQILIDTGFKIIKSIRFRGHFAQSYNPIFYILSYLFRKCILFFAGPLYSITNQEIFFKMKHAFGKNILIITEKI